MLGLLHRTRSDNRVGLSLADLAQGLRFDPTELEATVRQLMDLGWVGQIDGEERLILLVQPAQTPVWPLLKDMLLDSTEATRALWQPWQGMTLAEGRMLLMDLLEHATQRERVYRHEWQVGDLVMWDNTATVHRGRHYDLSQRREMRRSTTEEVSLTPT